MQKQDHIYLLSEKETFEIRKVQLSSRRESLYLERIDKADYEEKVLSPCLSRLIKLKDKQMFMTWDATRKICLSG